jgi:hypothetical protein
MQDKAVILYTVIWNEGGPEIIGLHASDPPDEPYYYLVGRERRHGRVYKGDPEYALSPLEALTFAVGRCERIVEDANKRVKSAAFIRDQMVEQLKTVERMRDLEVDRQR